MSITKDRLNLAGWLSITSAAVTIPIVGVQIFFTAIGGSGGKAVNAMLVVVSVGLFIYVFSSLKELLNSRFQFYDVDSYISALIWVNAISSILSIFSSGSGQPLTLIDVVTILAIILYGIIKIVFAVKVLRLSSDLYGLLKPFSYSSIAFGLCIASIILIPLGLFVSMAQDVILGMIFFRAAEQPLSITGERRYTFCNQCGSRNEVGDQFCSECGAKCA